VRWKKVVGRQALHRGGISINSAKNTAALHASRLAAVACGWQQTNLIARRSLRIDRRQTWLAAASMHIGRTNAA
jgi:hypothetical protein